MGKVLALMILAGLVVGGVKAAECVEAPVQATHDATWTPAPETPVGVEAQQTIEVKPVVIMARAVRKVPRQTAQCGAFDYRPLTQGIGAVRGFCN